jgi:nicotinate-nucleotide--dimethylbenzimidazole phosphoribosyltransferase
VGKPWNEQSVKQLLESAPDPDPTARAAVRERATRALRPSGALARLDEVAEWLAGWQATSSPAVRRPAAVVFVADHGVAEEEVSAYPRGVSRPVLRALEEGVATASVMARNVGASLTVVDVGVGRPTRNLLREPALSKHGLAECFEAGRAAVRALDCDLLILGEMGIANTTSAAALCATLFGLRAEDWCGRGTGIDDAGLARKIRVVEHARRRVGEVGPVEALRQLGGSELAAIAGGVLEARLCSIPVVLDGFVVTAAVTPLFLSRSDALEHCVAGHCSPEPGHRMLLDKLGMTPLIELGFRLGEGSGALATVPLIRLAAAVVTEVAKFSERGVT